MTDNQYYAHQWLSRMWYIDIEIEQLIVRREAIVSSMSGIGKYDAEHIPTQNGENATESKNIEYSIIHGQIDKKLSDLSTENIRTLEVIDKVEDNMLRGMLKARYLNRKTWKQIGKDYNYERSRAFDYRKIALDAVYPFIPKGEIIT